MEMFAFELIGFIYSLKVKHRIKEYVYKMLCKDSNPIFCQYKKDNCIVCV